MKKISWKGGALLAPVPPILVSCGSMEHPNLLTVGWTGITNTIPPKTYISLRPERYSYGLIQKSGIFVINLTTVDLVPAADFCGVRSGRDLDKFRETGLTAVPAPETGCPMLAESPLSLECRVTQTIPLGSHEMFLADIVAVHVDPTLIDKTGRLHLDHCGLVAYAHGEYFALGEKLGSFGFSVRKKPLSKKRKNLKSLAGTPQKQSLQASILQTGTTNSHPGLSKSLEKTAQNGRYTNRLCTVNQSDRSEEKRKPGYPRVIGSAAALKKPAKPCGRVPEWVPNNHHRKKKPK